MSMIIDIHKKKGIRPDFDVYIGRRVRNTEFWVSSKWANHYPTLEEYEDMVREYLWDDLEELEGKSLGCWCITTNKTEPLICHGQILMELLKEKNDAIHTE